MSFLEESVHTSHTIRPMLPSEPDPPVKKRPEFLTEKMNDFEPL